MHKLARANKLIASKTTGVIFGTKRSNRDKRIDKIVKRYLSHV